MNAEVQSYLEMYQTTQAYLKLSTAYCDYLGGIRWSSEDDALVYPDNKAFVFFAPIAEFLEGFSGGGRVIPFGCVLHWAHLLQHGRMHPVAEVRTLHESFKATGSLWRNAGALAAVLSVSVPETAEPPRLDHVCRRLRDRAFPIRWFTARFHEASGGPAEIPPIAPKDFERLIIARLAAYSEDDLHNWLAVGRGPVRDAGRALARQQPPPRTLTGVLAALLQRPRMAGAETHVTRLVGALTLPPRRLTPQELPVGGYADMTTHGDVEHLLPSQHALDDLEFVRRFAERELLFFRREEPPAQNRQEVVVLIDQGVRTWGDVRLVLAAAALALGKQSAGRGLRFLLAGTSNHGRPLDPMETDDETLGALIEASDLSLNPGAALEVVLEQPSEALRDVVMLTHPRNLREADVHAAARRAGTRDRLFAVTLDEEGAAVVSEVRRGAPVKLRQFHVEYTPAPVPPPPRPTLPTEPLAPWTGDVEPVPFPFRFGTSGAIDWFVFDHNGRWLLTVSAGGLLHLWGLSTADREVLPRAIYSEGLLGHIVSSTGVKGGFVLYFREQGAIYIAHYDVLRRRCWVGFIGPGTSVLATQYLAEAHALWLTISGQTRRDIRALCFDLTAGECLAPEQVAAQPRLQEALDAHFRVRAIRSNMLSSGAPDQVLAPSLGALCEYQMDVKTGTVFFRQVGFDDYAFVPVCDGKPLLKNASVVTAQAAGDVLAVRARLQDGTLKVMVFRGADGSTMCERRVSNKARFLLSFDGHWLAVDRGGRIIVEKLGAPREGALTRCGGCSMVGRLYLGEQSILLTLGQQATHRHVIRWSGKTVEFKYEHKKLGQEGFHTLGFEEVVRPGPQDTYVPTRGTLGYDWRRFPGAGHRNGLSFALDPYGQVTVIGANGSLLCMFMAFRDRLAAWLPDGSRCGSESLNGGPETPGAREKLAQALKNAGDPKT